MEVVALAPEVGVRAHVDDEEQVAAWLTGAACAGDPQAIALVGAGGNTDSDGLSVRRLEVHLRAFHGSLEVDRER